jgi:hypothetical protein
MSSPGKTAALCVLAILLIGYSMLSADEAPSSAVRVLQYVFLAGAAIGLIGSLVKLGRGS